MKELDVFKSSYESMGQKIEEVNLNIKEYMKEAQVKLDYHMRQTKDELMRMSDKLSKNTDQVT